MQRGRDNSERNGLMTSQHNARRLHHAENTRQSGSKDATVALPKVPYGLLTFPHRTRLHHAEGNRLDSCWMKGHDHIANGLFTFSHRTRLHHAEGTRLDSC